MSVFILSGRAALLVLSAYVVSISQANACSCAGTLPPIKEMAEATAVFTGKVTKLTRVPISKEYPDFIKRYDVTVQLAAIIKGKAFKRKTGSNITIHTGGGDGDCGYPFEEGEQYLFYASGTPANLETHICTRTQSLKGAENEILELQGRLPKIQAPARPPELLLKGRINDAGYRGYVFELRNYLHVRIFYGTPCSQILRNGQWEDFPANLGIGPREDLQLEEIAEVLATQRAETAQADADRPGLRGISYLDRMSTNALFAAMQSQTYPWRIGVRYETEPKVDAGKKFSRSQHIIWGPQMDASVETRTLTFDEAFGNTSMLPDPLGAHSAESDATPK